MPAVPHPAIALIRVAATLCISTAIDCYLILRICVVFWGEKPSAEYRRLFVKKCQDFVLSAAVGNCSMCSTKRLFRHYITLHYVTAETLFIECISACECKQNWPPYCLGSTRYVCCVYWQAAWWQSLLCQVVGARNEVVVADWQCFLQTVRKTTKF